MQRLSIQLAPEAPADWWEVEALYDLCFAPGRTALSSYRLREGIAPIAKLCWTARDTDGVLAGVVRCWPVCVGPHVAILLGPIAVHPTRQGEGIAALLMHKVIHTALGAGWARILLVGDLPFYARFGFERLTRVVMPPPTNPERVLGLALHDGAWDGVIGPVRKVDDCICAG
ncbi:GNAT family N-acetyltransferase [Yoonia sp.]|uniref:GNAT family N-acetyltransferase n=1 Tax=Yoonia sp. TaxID=2212373 RepID=UPI0019D819B0|nr:N-acetyltransferase [Yoonia sp.]MBE0412914.1 N-acetyltransferase [Yoonia sp.]